MCWTWNLKRKAFHRKSSTEIVAACFNTYKLRWPLSEAARIYNKTFVQLLTYFPRFATVFWSHKSGKIQYWVFRDSFWFWLRITQELMINEVLLSQGSSLMLFLKNRFLYSNNTYEPSYGLLECCTRVSNVNDNNNKNLFMLVVGNMICLVLYSIHFHLVNYEFWTRRGCVSFS